MTTFYLASLYKICSVCFTGLRKNRKVNHDVSLESLDIPD